MKKDFHCILKMHVLTINELMLEIHPVLKGHCSAVLCWRSSADALLLFAVIVSAVRSEPRVNSKVLTVCLAVLAIVLLVLDIGLGVYCKSGRRMNFKVYFYDGRSQQRVNLKSLEIAKHFTVSASDMMCYYPSLLLIEGS